METRKATPGGLEAGPLTPSVVPHPLLDITTGLPRMEPTYTAIVLAVHIVLAEWGFDLKFATAVPFPYFLQGFPSCGP